MSMITKQCLKLFVSRPVNPLKLIILTTEIGYVIIMANYKGDFMNNKLGNMIQSVTTVLAVLATIGAIIVSFTAARANIFNNFEFGVFIVTFLPFGIGIALWCLLMLAIAEGLHLLQTIAYNTSDLSDPRTKNLDVGTRNLSTARNSSVPSGGWKCNQCGKGNASYIGTCSCGNTKP